ncbi:potassium channel LctB [Natronobacillus azotifigens]|uniref:Potassium channel family protein n=1 Tax=Natronobacillus azotifigens TaxID=472978 RepID=A0A9J6RCD3_9BACI|nr:potassium channel family protein [Natronobacillus azotifigens]MCZ0702873.1 potassium channel family protein [Natronobacillus azotifigens]
MSLRSFIFEQAHKRSYFSYELFYSLVVVYFTVIVAFGMLYFILSLHEVILVQSNTETRAQQSFLSLLIDCLYFSGVTLMTVGYGDIIPVGWGRLLALTQAMIGYLLPTAFFLKIILKESYLNGVKKEADDL